MPKSGLIRSCYRKHTCSVLAAFLLYYGCVGELDRSERTTSKIASKSAALAPKLARESILRTRPQGTMHFVDQMKMTLANSQVATSAVTLQTIESRLKAVPTNTKPDVSCPFVRSPKGVSSGGSATSCRNLVEDALHQALYSAGSLRDTSAVELEAQQQSVLAKDELEWVKGWIDQAVFSGIEVGGAQAISVLREEKLCDQSTNATEGAYALGEKQGRALLEETKVRIMHTLPKAQCNGDLVAETIYGEAKSTIDAFVAKAPLCAGFKPADLQDGLDLTQAERDRRDGIEEGMRQAYEMLRVKLLDEWKCELCLCIARNMGGTIYCFTESQAMALSDNPQQAKNVFTRVANGREDYSLEEIEPLFREISDEIMQVGEPLPGEHRTYSNKFLGMIYVSELNQSNSTDATGWGSALPTIRYGGASPESTPDNFIAGIEWQIDQVAQANITAKHPGFSGPVSSLEQCSPSTTTWVVGSPLVADLDGNGIHFAKQRIAFDLAATSEKALMPGLQGQDALLVLDLDGNGRVDSGAELFGNATACGPRRCLDGVEAIAQHDTNRDGRLDRQDSVFARLRLWKDKNMNGRSEPAELTSLAAAGLKSITLDSRLDLAFVDQQGHAAMRGVTFIRQDGSQGVMPDVWFSLTFDTMPQDPRTRGIVSTLPDHLRLRGFPVQDLVRSKRHAR